MFFLGIIFLCLIGIFIYIYGGLRIGEPIKDDTSYMLFWIGYALLGLSIAIVVVLIFMWGQLHKKTGPPGPRGPMGNTGDPGMDGECDAKTSVLDIMYRIREAVADTLTGSTVLTEEGLLVNRYMEGKLQEQANSKQLSILLESAAKTQMEMAAYMSGIWSQWAKAISKKPKGTEFFTTAEAMPDSSPEIQAYFKNEIEKYDLWYWGSTPVFRPLEAEVCRRMNTGQGPNPNIPQPDKPPLDFIEIEYSDKQKDGLAIAWDSTEVFKTVGKKKPKPALYLPRSQTREGRTYYPVGYVVIETNPRLQTDTMKKAVLVTGDIVLPTGFDLEIDGGVKGIFYNVKCDIPGYVAISDVYINGITGKPTPDEVELFKMFNYDKQKNTALNRGYTGIVCVPNTCVEKINAPEKVYTFAMNNKSYQLRTAGADGYYLTRTGYVGSLYRFTDKCRWKADDIPVKQLESAFTDLGIGWFGYPAKTDDKYSIFKFLGIMPEGVIVHRYSGLKFYIRHYGGVEPNNYLLVSWDNESKSYIRTLKVISSDIVQAENVLSSTDKTQQWRIIADPMNRDYFRLKSVAYPNKYLSLTNDVSNDWNRHRNANNPSDISLKNKRPNGLNLNGQTITGRLVFSTGDSNQANKTLFSMLPAYGMSYDKRAT